ncbi:LCP family protein [Streptomyces sp. NPDC023327]|uniref:LCP family protein n=1 Tax=Streptomyces sp. NPDC023327 TaxID=3157088 RepID=UPI0033C562BA
MNDRQYDPYAGGDPYAGEYGGAYAADQYGGAQYGGDPYGADQYGVDQYEVVGYDEYGQPVYQLVRQPQGQQQRQQPQVPQQSQAPEQYQAPQQPQVPQQYQGYGYDPYAGAQQQAYDAQAPAATSYDNTAWVPQQQQPQAQQPPQDLPPEPEPEPESEPQPRTASQPDYKTEQFSFIEEPDEDSEDVIDWLKFTESRTERREEAKRRGRSRVVALAVVLALVVAGGVGYLWFAGLLPGRSGGEDGAAGAGGPQKRDVIVLHLHNTKAGGTSTALLVNNTTTGQGATVLLPNSLSVSDDNGSATTLGKSVDDDGSTGTREAIDTVLGTEVEGTWRLDTPYLDNLVELVGNIDVDTDTDVPDPKAGKGEAPLVKKGERQTLSGPMAVAYATYRASGESESAQLARFGQVMQGVLRKLSSDPQAATTTVESLTQILDPSLKEKDLGAFLAKLAERAKGGDYKTTLLPVRADGTLADQAGDRVVKDILGGAVKSPEQGAAVRVAVTNASGAKSAAQEARISLVNGGYTFVDGGAGAAARPASQVTYADAARKAQATEVAKTLGLPTGAVRKGRTTANADVSVVLGQDYATR